MFKISSQKNISQKRKLFVFEKKTPKSPKK